jgi:hypothetical protein
MMIIKHVSVCVAKWSNFCPLDLLVGVQKLSTFKPCISFVIFNLIEKVSLFGRRKSSYWDFLKTSLISTKGGVDSAIRFASYNPEVIF